MSPGELSRPAARAWVCRWDAMQAAFIPDREARFRFMFNLLGAGGLPARFRALDVGAGPGSLSTRLLERFPHATAVALDYDPVLPYIGQRALSARLARRLAWASSDLRGRTWTDALPGGRYHAILSTTALHWLHASELRAFYREAHRLLLPGGLLLNGDKAPISERLPALRGIVDRVVEEWVAGSPQLRRGNPWLDFWRAAAKDPVLGPLVRERAQRFPESSHHGHEPSADEHLRALKRAGFSEAAVVSRRLSNVVLLARR